MLTSGGTSVIGKTFAHSGRQVRATQAAAAAVVSVQAATNETAPNAFVALIIRCAPCEPNVRGRHLAVPQSRPAHSQVNATVGVGYLHADRRARPDRAPVQPSGPDSVSSVVPAESR